VTLSLIDTTLLILYGLLILGVSLGVSQRGRTSSGYFIAGRSMPGWAVAMTLMATLIGSGTIVGHPATVYQKGMILLLGNLTLIVVLLFVARFIVPFYRNVVGMSAYEYLGQRFGLVGRYYASLGFLADRIFDLGVTLLTTAIALNVMTGWPLADVILWSGLFTVLYTMIGGMQAVVWTSVLQGFIFVAAAIFIVLRLIFAPEAGTPGAVVVEAWKAGKFTLGTFEISWASLTDPLITSQWLFILAYMTNWSRRYVADQHMVQRYLIARTDAEASRGALWNAFLCVPVYMVFMFIGACLFGYYQLVDPVIDSPPELVDQIVPHFIVQHMPIGMVGLILAAILAASMSSISGDLNSIATVLTVDYLKGIYPRAKEGLSVLFGRIMVLTAGGFAILVALFMAPEEGMASIMERGVTIAAILSGGTLGLFFLGFLTRRATREGCYWGIAACLLFTAWALLTSPSTGGLDLGAFNYRLHPILIGLLGHLILFGVGYVASLVGGGYRPDNVSELTFRRKQKGANSPQ
jgi:SSS family solute:Na+ symporter